MFVLGRKSSLLMRSEPLEINEGHRLTRGMVGLWVMSQGWPRPFNLASRRLQEGVYTQRAIPTGAPVPSRIIYNLTTAAQLVHNVETLSAGFDGVDDGLEALASDNNLPVSSIPTDGKLTVGVTGMPRSSPPTSSGVAQDFIAARSAAASGGAAFLLRLVGNGVGTDLQFAIRRTDAGAANSATLASGMGAGLARTIVGVNRSNTDCRLYRLGAEAATGSTDIGSGASTALTRLGIGRGYGPTNWLDGHVGMAFVSLRDWSADEVLEWSRDPSLLVRSVVSRRYHVLKLGLYTLTADPGQLTLTGTAAFLKRGYLLTANSGQVTLAGTAATLRSVKRLDAQPGQITITGTAAALKYNRVVQAAAGQITLSGTAATLSVSGVDYTLTAAPGSLVLAGTAVSFRINYRLDCVPGNLVIYGGAATLVYSGAPISTGSGDILRRRRRR